MRPEPVQGVALASGDLAPCTPGGRPAIWAATGRSGGSSPAPFDSLNLAVHVGDDPGRVAANRDLLRRGVGADDIAVLRAVHGSHVAVVDTPGDVEAADAVITDTPGLGVVALGADCLVLGIVGDDGRTVAVAHCGWRGLVGDVTGAVLRVLGERGVRPAHVVLGPSICGACYPVPVDRVAELRDACSAAVCEAAIVRCADGQPGIDVRAGVRARVQELGWEGVPVTAVDRCTAEDPGLFSHRRDGLTGRQGLILVSRADAEAPREGRMSS